MDGKMIDVMDEEMVGGMMVGNDENHDDKNEATNLASRSMPTITYSKLDKMATSAHISFMKWQPN